MLEGKEPKSIHKTTGNEVTHMPYKTALITGASRGIGAAIARRLAADGYHLILNSSRHIDALEALKKECEQHYGITCLICPGSVGSSRDCAQVFDTLQKRHSHLDVLVNNAGVSQAGVLTALTDEEWLTLLNTNLSGTLYMSRNAVPLMLAAGEGKIINISSVWGSVGASCETAYSATKGGVNAFTKALAKELAPSRIAVNAIACGAIDTTMNDRLTAEDKAALCAEIPAGRFGTPEEVASTVSLLTRAPAYLTGQILTLDGGWT